MSSLPGAAIPDLSVNALAVAGDVQVAVGSANGYPAIWRKAGTGPWTLVTSLSAVSGGGSLARLTTVTHGPEGWLALGVPGPVVMTSPDGITWHQVTGGIMSGLAGVAGVSAAGGPDGYAIVGKLVTSTGSCLADVWWSPDLVTWFRVHDVNLATGSSQVLAVAATAHGFLSVGSHEDRPVAWMPTSDNTAWRTIRCRCRPARPGLRWQQVAVNGNRVVATGTQDTPSGQQPFAALSVNGGATWQLIPISSPGPATGVTALSADGSGFVAAGQYGEPGRQDVVEWTSANGSSWQQTLAGGTLGGAGTHADQRAGAVRLHRDRSRLHRDPAIPADGRLDAADPSRPLTACSPRMRPDLRPATENSPSGPGSSGRTPVTASALSGP